MRNYRLSHLQDDDDDDVTCIQMISALVLQLVQSVAKIPPPVNTDIRQSAFDGGAIAQEQLSAENVDENQIGNSKYVFLLLAGSPQITFTMARFSIYFC